MTEQPQDMPPEDAVPPPSSPSPEPRRPRRLAVKSLIGLYALSLLAAGVLLLRPATKEAPKPTSIMKLPSGLLSSEKKEYVAVVEINGAIYDQDGGGVWAKGASSWGRRIEKLAKKSEVKAIVLSINSPGGSVGSVQELHALLMRVRQEQKKPVVAQLGDVAASGGYYLAAACDKVVAHPGTLVGSIGVIFNTMNVEGLMAKLGVRSQPIKSGKMKDIGSMSRPMTEEERALLQGLIDDAYGQFLGAVAEGRHLPAETVRPLADGRIFTGGQALKAGLVDQLGDSWAAVKLAGELGGITGKPEILRESETLSGIMDLLDSKLAFMGGPDLGFLREMGTFSTGLEYRWRP